MAHATYARHRRRGHEGLPSRLRFWKVVQMNGEHNVILEHALLPVKPGAETAFEAAIEEAKAIISSMPGYAGLEVSRGIEHSSTYLLEDHTEGFRGSPEYQQWKALLHHFYDPFPVVEHFETILTA